jgi:hypothetical protein
MSDSLPPSQALEGIAEREGTRFKGKKQSKIAAGMNPHLKNPDPYKIPK